MTTDLIPQVTDLTFDDEVLSAQVPVLVDFTAAWCAPCRALKPILSQLAAEGAGRHAVVTVDADESPLLAARFGVKGFPTLILFSGGKEVARRLGLGSKSQIAALLGSAVPC